jgi:hypothetical protein
MILRQRSAISKVQMAATRVHFIYTLMSFALAGRMLGAVMDRSGSAKRTRHVTLFPDELMHIIFSKLEETNDKMNAGLACKEWDQLLKAGTPAARHWDIHYTVKRTMPSTEPGKKYKNFTPDQSTASVERSAHCTSPFLCRNDCGSMFVFPQSI